MKIIELGTNARGYVWNHEAVTFETCEQGTYKDKLFMICMDGTVWEVVKVLEIEQTDSFRSTENAQVLKQIMLGEHSYTYGEVFLSLARESKFSLGSSPEFPGFTYGRTWNGFVSPYYKKEVFEEICNYFSVVYGNEEGDDLAECRCFYDDSTDEFYCEDYYNDYMRERIGFPTVIQTPNGPVSVYFFEGCWDWVECKEETNGGK